VKQGHLYDYQIKRYQDDVMADNFKFGQNRAIIVALPNDVTMATKLSTPTKALRNLSLHEGSPLRTPTKVYIDSCVLLPTGIFSLFV
jgi:hypothetical protein